MRQQVNQLLITHALGSSISTFLPEVGTLFLPLESATRPNNRCSSKQTVRRGFHPLSFPLPVQRDDFSRASGRIRLFSAG